MGQSAQRLGRIWPTTNRGSQSVEVRARTGFGDIRVFRATGPDVVESAIATGRAEDD